MAFNNKACGPRLRGLRYHIRENQWVYDRIRDLRFLDFEETIDFYIEFQERYGIGNELRACDPETEYERRKRLKAQALLALPGGGSGTGRLHRSLGAGAWENQHHYCSWHHSAGCLRPWNNDCHFLCHEAACTGNPWPDQK